MLGTTVGNYTITAKIDQGGMAVVYTAQHTDLDRKAVVKVLRHHLHSDDEIPRRFRNEASAIASIKHPGIVEVLDFGTLEDGHLYILMEFLEGENLRDRLDCVGKLSIEACLQVARQTTDALGAAHGNNIVHRDLKPANMFLVPDHLVRGGERVKLLDFGIAKLMDSNTNASLVTQSGVIMGTPAYMSPEQCRGAGEVDHRTDFYALGCILYEMLSGRPPFTNKGAGELIVLHLTQEPPRLRELDNAIPPEVETIVARLLAKEPEGRYRSADELIAALDELAVGHGNGRHAQHARPSHHMALITPTPSSQGHGLLPTGSAAEIEPTQVNQPPFGDGRAAHHGPGGGEPTARMDHLGPQVAMMIRQEQATRPPTGGVPRSGGSEPYSQFDELNPFDSLATTMPDANMASTDERTAQWILDAPTTETAPPRPNGSAPHGLPNQPPPVADHRSPPEQGPYGQSGHPHFGGAAHPASSSQPQPSVGRVAPTGRSRLTRMIQMGVLAGGALGMVIYLMVWMVGSSQSGGAMGEGARDGGADPSTAMPRIVVKATRYRPELVALRGGLFMMGSPHTQKWRSRDETPRHEVSLSSFYMCRTEITQRQWKGLMRDNPSDCRNRGCSKGSLPVNNVSWYKAIEYFNRLSKKEGLTPCYEREDTEVTWRTDCTGYRFPTEAEWEYAARAGSGTIYSFGDDPEALGTFAWYRENTKRARAVATREPNAWGLFDMHGNVQEWVWDQFEKFYPSKPEVDPRGPERTGHKRVMRGGSFRNAPKDLRSAVRYWNEPVSVNWDTGLRCARSRSDTDE